MPWNEIGLVALYALAAPFTIYLWLDLRSFSGLYYFLFLVATAYAVTAVVVMIEAAIAAPRRRALVAWPVPAADGQPADRLPPVTAVVPAYLPNEQEIIVGTLEYLLFWLDVPPDRLQLILAYNTPQPLPVERELQQLAACDPRLLLLRVEGSTSKAENVNAALAHATGEVTAIFDADHWPEPLCFRKSLRWLRAGYDVVQGRCSIRNRAENWLTRMITVEFGTMYAVCHTSRSFAADTAIFGGSNGYWRTPVLRSLRMDPAMLTEDIDVSVRAMLAGHRILHDRSIISTELAPSRFASWFYQRLRWAQGWHQVTLKHSRAIMTSPALTRWQKVYWTYILPWRELYGLLSPQALPILLAAIAVHLWSGRLWHWDLYFAATTALTMVSGAWSALVAHRHMALAETAGRRRDTAAYILLSPLLTLLRNAITLVAWLREARRQRDWITTTRGCALPWETARIVEAQ